MRLGLIARNVAWNGLGMGLPLLGAIFSIPILIERIGDSGFGVLSLVWLAVGYFSLLDLGLGRALTKYVAECLLADDRQELSALCSTSMVIAMGIGCVFALLFLIVLACIQYWFGSFSAAEINAGLWVAFSLPLVVSATALRGVLEGLQQFKLLNLIRGPSGALIFAFPALLTLLVPTLSAAVCGVVLIRLVMLCALFSVVHQSIPLRLKTVNFSWLEPLVRFGGWLAVSNFVGPIIVYVDRLIIGGLLGASLLAYYSAPFEVVSKLIMVPTALTAVLFPLLSQLQKSDPTKAIAIRHQFERWLASLFLPGALVGVLVARSVLDVWLGDDFAEKSTLVLQVLIVGVALNCLTMLPYTALQSYGKTRWIAMVHLIELPPYVLVLAFLTIRFGLVGAAVAWSMRALLDLVLMQMQMRRAERQSLTLGIRV